MGPNVLVQGLEVSWIHHRSTANVREDAKGTVDCSMPRDDDSGDILVFERQGHGRLVYAKESVLDPL